VAANGIGFVVLAVGLSLEVSVKVGELQGTVRV
jgi:hypothetical protein